MGALYTNNGARYVFTRYSRREIEIERERGEYIITYSVNKWTTKIGYAIYKQRLLLPARRLQ